MASENEILETKPGMESPEKKPDTSGKTTINPSSPYYFGSSDNPGTPLVAVALTGDNYRNWARSMKTALRTKTKLGFVDGTVKKPPTESSEFHDLDKVDSMVTAWIINLVNPALHSSIAHASTARGIWLDLKERFEQTNAPRIHQLWRDLCLIQQETSTNVTEYYTKFKGVVDELSELQPFPQFSCGASKELTQRDEELQVHLFLGGLHSD